MDSRWLPKKFISSKFIESGLNWNKSTFGSGFLLDIPEEVLINRLLLRGRKDDTEETIRTRVDIYKKTTEPLIEYFKDLSLLEYIDADRDLKTISSDIKQKMAWWWCRI